MDQARKGLWVRFVRLFLTELWKHVWSKIIGVVFVLGAIAYSFFTGKLSAPSLRDNFAAAAIPFIWAVSLLVFIHVVRTSILLTLEIGREQAEMKPIRKISPVLTAYGQTTESLEYPTRSKAYGLRILLIACCFALAPVIASYAAWRAALRTKTTISDSQHSQSTPVVDGHENKVAPRKVGRHQGTMTSTSRAAVQMPNQNTNRPMGPTSELNPSYREMRSPEIKAASELLGMRSEELRKYVATVVEDLRIFDAGWLAPPNLYQINEPAIDDPNGAKKQEEEIKRRDQSIQASQTQYQDEFSRRFNNLDTIAEELILRCQQKGTSADVQYDSLNPPVKNPFPPPYMEGISGLRAASYLEALTRKCL